MVAVKPGVLPQTAYPPTGDGQTQRGLMFEGPLSTLGEEIKDNLFQGS